MIEWLAAFGIVTTAAGVVVQMILADMRLAEAAEIEIARNVDYINTNPYKIEMCDNKYEYISLVNLSNTAVSAIISSGGTGKDDTIQYVDINIAILMRNKFVDELIYYIRGDIDVSSKERCEYLAGVVAAVGRCDNVIRRGVGR